MGPLDHIRVLDLTQARSGPTCVRQLGDLGADVIQVSHPRKAQIGGSDGDNLHRNKRSIVLDLGAPAGYEAFLRLVDWADVLVENNRPGVKHRLRIDPETLHGRNPRLIYASISGFGQDGPNADRAGVDQIAQGMGGLMSVTGPPGTGPWRTGIAISDTVAGTFLAQGVLAALVARERTGLGQWVHTSLLETMVNLMDFQACRWLTDGVVPAQEGNDHPTFFPMGCYRCADGHLNIAGMKDFDAFLAVIEGSHLVADPRFATSSSRQAHRAEFNTACEQLLARQSTAHWVEALNAKGIPAGPVYRMNEVFDDPQVRHLQLTATLEHPSHGSVRVLRHPVNLSATPTQVGGPAPSTGADTRSVLAMVGLSDAEVQALLDTGAAREGVHGDRWL